MSDKLHAMCPECKTANPVGSKFCNSCGAFLEAATVMQEAAPPSAAPVEKPKGRRTWLIIAAAVVGLCAVVACIAVLLGGGGADESPAPAATEQPTEVQARETQEPEATEAPTATPMPPTDTPIPTDTPTPTPEPTPIVISGQGQAATEPIQPPASVSVAFFAHNGSSNFVVTAYQANDTNLLINEIGVYNGSRPLIGVDPVILDINADGAWTVEIVPIWAVDSPAFSGRGDAVSGLFEPPETGAWNVNHDGTSNFIVLLHCVGGSDIVQNEIGAVSGSTMIRFSEGPCLWEVQADGSWSLAPR